MAQAIGLDTAHGAVRAVRLQAVRAYHVGYRPDPWAWTPWEYAGADGRFHGRWDDPHGTWRSLYLGVSPLACYLEVLARFRPEPQMAAELAEIVDNDDNDHLYPTAPAGHLPRSWCGPRLLGSGRVSGVFAVPGHRASLAALRGRFLPPARALGLADLDGAAIRDSRPRALTQAIAAWLYALRTPDGAPLNGIQFESRHGDGLTLWSVYERDPAAASPPEIEQEAAEPIAPDDPQLLEAMRLHRLSWLP
ncbi:RES domain-containing protein [uncultured Mycobacterium sp.]|uniref:RES domain-containing protein n=1 Tax=uncultured Mycobacterium sp. TaxID=171292 RepID=UPI0035CC560C